jgi:formamidopyrimidine-DNA glycosylase
MPEYPEVRAHAERLTEAYRDVPLTGFRPISFTALKTFSPAPEVAVGQGLLEVTTRGKHLLMRFEPATFVIHLMQGGRLRVDEKESAKPRGGLARWKFDGRPALLLTEAGTEHKAGVWVVDGDPLRQPPLDDLGPEIDPIAVEELADRVRARSGRLHGVLRDQRVVAGIGRRLANEICFRAQLSPFANAAKLTDDEVARLHAALGECVTEGLAYERTREDMSSSKERPGAVHGRKGEACPVCGDTIRTVEYSKYTVSYCATCQTDGKVLADNTTSKFLK